MPNKNTISLLVFLLTISLYAFTLTPSLTWGDGVRLQTEAISGESFILSEMRPDEFTPDPFPFSRVGITAWDHPLYIVLGYSLVRVLPSIDSLWLVNLISAIFGAASIVLVFVLGNRYTASVPAAAYAALALGVSHTFWWHSTTPEVYTLFIFLLLLCLFYFERFEKTGSYTALTFSAFFLGLSLTDHILGILAVPALGLYWLLTGGFPRVRRIQWEKSFVPVTAFVAGFSFYLIQFVRLAGDFQLGQITSSAVGSTFLNGLGGFSPFAIAESLITYILFLFVQFGPIGLVLGIVGLQKIFVNADLTLRKIVALYGVYTAFGIFYRVTDQFAFFLTSHVFFAILMGIGAHHFFSTLQSKLRLPVGSLLVLTIGAAPFVYHSLPGIARTNGIDDSFLGIPQVGPGLRDGLAYYIDPNKRGDFAAYEFGYETITNLPPGSVVIAEWYTDTDEYFVLRYFFKIEELRPDVTLYGWPTKDPFSFDTRLVIKTIEEAFPERPVYLASLSERFYSASRLVEEYCIVSEHNLFRLHPVGTAERSCLGRSSITE